MNTTNQFFEVIEPFEVLASVGICESNTWVGSSQVLGVIYRRVIAEPGDFLALLVGGDFLVHDGTSMEVTLVLDDRHIFSRQYGSPPVQPWPTGKLSPCAPVARPAAGWRPDDDLASTGRPRGARPTIKQMQARGATCAANGVDWVLSPSA